MARFKLTFVYPDFESLGVEYLMAQVIKNGFETELILYKAENTYLARKERFLDYRAIVRRVIDSSPDLVCFSCVTDNYQSQLKIAKALKRKIPGLPTVFGGIHTTAVPKLVIKEAAVDALAIGEADISFLDFLKNCHKKNNRLVFPDKEIKGVVFKKNKRKFGKFIEGDLIDLDNLPFPHRDPFVLSLRELRLRYYIMTSRGCPFGCAYCFHATMSKIRGNRLVRQRSPENVIRELLWAKSKYKFKVVYFIDDNFTTNKKWLLNFLRLYRDKIGLPFGCASHPECMDYQVAKELALAGCIFITIGVQSLCPQLSKKVIHRVVNKEKIVQAIQSLKKAGIMIQVDHMFGIPGDTLKNQEEAILFYNKYRPDLISVFWLTLYPKTPIVQTFLKQRLASSYEIGQLESGKRILKTSFHDGGSMKNPKPYYSVQFIINYLPFLPRWLVRLLIRTKTYKIFSIGNYYLSTVIPRVLKSIFDKRYFWGRNLLISFFNP